MSKYVYVYNYVCTSGITVCTCLSMLLAANSMVCYCTNVCTVLMFICAFIIYIQMYFCPCLHVTISLEESSRRCKLQQQAKINSIPVVVVIGKGIADSPYPWTILRKQLPWQMLVCIIVMWSAHLI